MIDNKYLKVYDTYDQFAVDSEQYKRGEDHIAYITNQYEVIYWLYLEHVWKPFNVQTTNAGILEDGRSKVNVTLNYVEGMPVLKYLPNIPDPERIVKMDNFLANYPYIEYISDLETINLTSLQNAFSGSNIKELPKLCLDKIVNMDYFIDNCPNLEHAILENINGFTKILNEVVIHEPHINLKEIITKNVDCKFDIYNYYNLNKIECIYNNELVGTVRLVFSNIESNNSTNLYVYSKNVSIHSGGITTSKPFPKYIKTENIDFKLYSTRNYNIENLPIIECDILNMTSTFSREMYFNNFPAHYLSKIYNINSKYLFIVSYIDIKDTLITGIPNYYSYGVYGTSVSSKEIDSEFYNKHFDNEGNSICGYLKKEYGIDIAQYVINFTNIYTDYTLTNRQNLNLDFTNNINKNDIISIYSISKQNINDYSGSFIIKNPKNNTKIVFYKELNAYIDTIKIINDIRDKIYFSFNFYLYGSGYNNVCALNNISVKGNIETDFIFYKKSDNPEYDFDNNYNNAVINSIYTDSNHKDIINFNYITGGVKIYIKNIIGDIDLSKLNFTNHLINNKRIYWLFDESIIDFDINSRIISTPFIIDNKLYSNTFSVYDKNNANVPIPILKFNNNVEEIIINFNASNNTYYCDMTRIFIDYILNHIKIHYTRGINSIVNLFYYTNRLTIDSIDYITIDCDENIFCYLFISTNDNYIYPDNFYGNINLILWPIYTLKENIIFINFVNTKMRSNYFSTFNLPNLNSESIKKLLISLENNSNIVDGVEQNTTKNLTITETHASYLTEQEIADFTAKNYSLSIIH